MLRCVRGIAATLALVALAPLPVGADVAVTWRRTSGAAGGQVQTILEHISGARQREDQGPEGQPVKFSVIRDLSAMRELLVWHTFRFVVTNTLRPERDARAEAGAPSGRPTGATATILDRVCREFRYERREQGFVLTGTYWLPENGPGAQEYAALYARLGHLRMTSAEPAEQAREPVSTMDQRVRLYNDFLRAARREGIPYRLQVEIAGTGAPLRVSQDAQRIVTSAVPAVTFVPPAGYEQRKQ